jgi:hypothetical protein
MFRWFLANLLFYPTLEKRPHVNPRIILRPVVQEFCRKYERTRRLGLDDSTFPRTSGAPRSDSNHR